MSKQSSSKVVKSSRVSLSDAAKAGPEMLKAINQLAETYGFLGTLTTKERRRTVNTWFNQEYIQAVAARYDAQHSLVGGDFDTASFATVSSSSSPMKRPLRRPRPWLERSRTSSFRRKTRSPQKRAPSST